MIYSILLAAGLIGGVVPAQPGTVIAPPECTVAAVREQAVTAVGNTIPLGAPIYRQQYRPGDELPYAMDFTAILLAGETISAVTRLRMPPAAAALGIMIDQIVNPPIFDSRKVQIWLTTDPAVDHDTVIDIAGTRFPILYEVATILQNGSRGRRFGRTGVLVARPL